MEENNFSQNQTATTMGSKKTLFIGVGFILLVVLIVVFFIVNKKQAGLSAKQLEARHIPSYFVQGEAKNVTITDTKSFVLSKKEILKPAVQYTVSKSQADTFAQVLKEMSNNGWAAIGGSTQTDQETIIKMNNGTDTLFITLTGGKIKDQNGQMVTTVTIVPVERK